MVTEYRSQSLFTAARNMLQAAGCVRKDRKSTQFSAADNDINPLQTDAFGGLRVNTEYQYPVYSVGLNVNPANHCTDVFAISPDSTPSKIIGVRRITVSSTIATTANDQLVTLIRRITLDTSGTKTVPTGVPRDNRQSAATAVLALYTANPTLGTVHSSGAATPDGIMMMRRIAASVAGGTAIPQTADFDFRDSPILLTLATSQLAINLASTDQDLANLDLYVEWDERATTN